MKVRDVLKLIKDDGWEVVRTRGSHRILAHPHKTGIVVVPGKPGDDLPIGTARSILKQAQLEGEE